MLWWSESQFPSWRLLCRLVYPSSRPSEGTWLILKNIWTSNKSFSRRWFYISHAQQWRRCGRPGRSDALVHLGGLGKRPDIQVDQESNVCEPPKCLVNTNLLGLIVWWTSIHFHGYPPDGGKCYPATAVLQSAGCINIGNPTNWYHFTVGPPLLCHSFMERSRLCCPLTSEGEK